MLRRVLEWIGGLLLGDRISSLDFGISNTIRIANDGILNNLEHRFSQLKSQIDGHQKSADLRQQHQDASLGGIGYRIISLEKSLEAQIKGFRADTINAVNLMGSDLKISSCEVKDDIGQAIYNRNELLGNLRDEISLLTAEATERECVDLAIAKTYSDEKFMEGNPSNREIVEECTRWANYYMVDRGYKDDRRPKLKKLIEARILCPLPVQNAIKITK